MAIAAGTQYVSLITRGYNKNMSIEKCMELYPKWIVITAVVLYIIHRLLPYDYREKFPHDNPPPKFLGTFSLGELIQYIIQVLVFPIIIFIAIALKLSGNSGNIPYIVFVVLLIIWWFVPKALARIIDGW